jgi:purine-nucleoside phosphorylase
LKADVEAAVAFLRGRTAIRPAVAVVLGSGLGPVADAMEEPVGISTREIPNYPPSTVEGHEGTFLFGRLSGKPALLIKGRVHSYEGYDMPQVAFPIRTAALLGATMLLLTNAAGGIRSDLAPGRILLISDHLNLLGRSPLEGRNVDAWGPRFVDLSATYDAGLRAIAREEARRLGIDLAEGVYAACRGPQYETPAEIRMLRVLGADAVGMSTVPEAIAARHMGLRVAAFSMISNLAAGVSEKPISHEEVLEAGKEVARTLTPLLLALIARS